jgi:hypothetical protein
MKTRIVDEDIEIILNGKRREMRDLYEELHTWTPSGGWSRNAEQFFDELRRAGGLDEGQ